MPSRHQLTPRRAAALALVFFARSLAAQDTARIAPVIVTATRVPITIDNSPSAVSVISGEALQREGVKYVSEALRRVPGVAIVQTGSFGGTTTLFLRGGESKYVKVLVDGVPVNDPGGTFDFATLTTDNIERIEVVRGPASVLYGADAVTGVVQVFTRRGVGRPTLSVSASGGGYGTRDIDAGVNGVLAGADYSLGLAQHYTNGIYEFNSAFRNNVLSGTVRVDPDSRTTLRATLRYTDAAFHYPTSGSGEVVDSNSMRADDRTVVGLDATRTLGNRFTAHLALASNVTAGGTDDPAQENAASSFASIDDVRRRSGNLWIDARLPRAATVSIGVQREQEDERSESQFVSGAFQSASVFRASRVNDAVYSQLLASPLSPVTLALGGRYDHNERFGGFGTYRAAGSWSLTSTTRLRASMGSAFREPTFFENYATGFVTGNPNLEPERSTSWDAGVQQRLFTERLSVGVTYFNQRFRQMIDYTGDTNSCGASYCNIALARATGQEFEARATIIAGLSADASFTHLDTRVLRSGFDTSSAGLFRAGEQLVRRPRTSWSAGVAYFGSNGLSTDLRVQRVGERADKNYSDFPATPVTLAGYTLLDFSAEVPLVRAERGAGRPSAAATLRVDNLTDEKYVSVFGYRSPRRQFLGGLRVTF
jgi:vitamin B12 transporter